MRGSLIVLLAALSMLGPLGIDMYLPALPAISEDLSASLATVQQTLGVYLCGLAVMMLFYGTLSDCYGRRPVVLCSTAAFALTALWVALSGDETSLLMSRLLQGASAGAGGVVTRALIQDRHQGSEGIRAISKVMMAFAIAPAVAPIIGGWVLTHFGWRPIFYLQAILAAALWIWCYVSLPETLPANKRQQLRIRSLTAAYRQTATDTIFQGAAASSALCFFSFSLYIGAAAPFIGQILHLEVTDFGWLFVPLVLGMITGSATSARVSRSLSRAKQLQIGFSVLLFGNALNLVVFYLPNPTVPWAVIPLGIGTFGLALINPPLLMMAVTVHQTRLGLANSLLSFESTMVFAAVSSLLAPMLSHSGLTLAIGVAVASALGAIVGYLTMISDGNRATNLITAAEPDRCAN